MKAIFSYKTLITTLVLSTTCLLSQQTLAVANPVVVNPVLPDFSSGLFPSRSQELFREWQQRVDREIRNLTSVGKASPEPRFENNVNPEVELEDLPQLKPDTLSQPTQELLPQKQQSGKLTS
jgi:hypothetical protein